MPMTTKKPRVEKPVKAKRVVKPAPVAAKAAEPMKAEVAVAPQATSEPTEPFRRYAKPEFTQFEKKTS